MKQKKSKFFVRRIFRDESGQALPMLAMALVGLLAMEIGRASCRERV